MDLEDIGIVEIIDVNVNNYLLIDKILRPQDLHLRNLPTLVCEKANSNLDGAQEPENTPRTSVRGFLTL